MRLKLMSFNIHHGRGTDGILNLERIARVIRTSDADIIGLNEVDRHFSRRSNYVDQATALADTLNMDVAFGPAITRFDKNALIAHQYGNALLSRFPITSHTNHHFNFQIVENRALLETIIDVGRTQLYVYVTHLSVEPLTHKRQTTAIINTVQSGDRPVVILGDWNMKPRSSAWKALHDHRLFDAWNDANDVSGFTYPSYHPKSRIDYIFISEYFNVLETAVIKEIPEASDHLPVTAVINL